MLNREPIELRVEVKGWPKKVGVTLLPPEQLQLAILYEANIEDEDVITEELYLRRTPVHDELWVRLPAYEINAALAGRAPRGGEAPMAARRLFKALTREREGFWIPTTWFAGPLIGKAMFDAVIREVKTGWHNNAEAARAHESPIVALARRLGLDPQPRGTSPVAWQANCPRHDHQLLIFTDANDYWCPYCRRQGGEDELGAFVGARTPKRQRTRRGRRQGVKS